MPSSCASTVPGTGNNSPREDHVKKILKYLYLLAQSSSPYNGYNALQNTVLWFILVCRWTIPSAASADPGIPHGSGPLRTQCWAAKLALCCPVFDPLLEGFSRKWLTASLHKRNGTTGAGIQLRTGPAVTWSTVRQKLSGFMLIYSCFL